MSDLCSCSRGDNNSLDLACLLRRRSGVLPFLDHNDTGRGARGGGDLCRLHQLSLGIDHCLAANRKISAGDRGSRSLYDGDVCRWSWRFVSSWCLSVLSLAATSQGEQKANGYGSSGSFHKFEVGFATYELDVRQCQAIHALRIPKKKAG